MNPSPLRPIAIVRPTSVPRPLRLGLGTTEPAALRRTARFVAAFGTVPGIGARIARRSLGFASRLAMLGGHRAFALPEMSLDLRHRPRRARASAVGRRFARWPAWSAPPAIGIPARHQRFLGLAVLPEAAMFAGAATFTDGPLFPMESASFQDFVFPEESSIDEVSTLADDTPAEVPASLPPFAVPAFTRPVVTASGGRVAPSRAGGVGGSTPRIQAATGSILPANVVRAETPPLILHYPRVERAAVAALGLIRTRRMTEALGWPAAMVTVGDLAARVADHHALPEMFAAGDVSRSLASARGDREVPSASSGQALRFAQDGRIRGAVPVRSGDALLWSEPDHSSPYILSDAKDLSPREGTRRTDLARPNFTLELLRHATWRPAHEATGARFGGRSAADRATQIYDRPGVPNAERTTQDAILVGAEWAARVPLGAVRRSTGVESWLVSGELPMARPSARVQSRADTEVRPYERWILAPPAHAGGSTASLPGARSMRVEPVTRTLVSPLPPSTLPAPAADSRRSSPAPISAAAAWSGATPEPVLPRFVAERLAQATRIAPPSIAAEVFASAVDVVATTPTLRARPRREPFAPAQADTHHFPSPAAAVPLELPMVVRRLSFGSDRIQRALAGTVSPVWGALGRQVAPAIPSAPSSGPILSSVPSGSSMPSPPGVPIPSGVPGEPAAYPLPLGRGTRRDAGPATASALPFFAAFPGTRLTFAGTPPAPLARTAGPVVYRSPLADRAEPTEAQRAEAAEVMATSVGQPLPPLVRRSMEHRLGMDLAAVRVHSGPAVMRAANLIGARAMARGTDVFMPGGVADSAAAAEMPLLAHELTHVAQHLGRPASPSATPPLTPLTLARRTSDAEHEADRIERQIVERLPNLPGLGSLPTGGLPQVPSLPHVPDLDSLKDSALTLARPALGALQKPVQQAEQMAESALGKAEHAVGSILGTESHATAAAPDPAQLAEQVYHLLERRLLVERERGGYRR